MAGSHFVSGGGITGFRQFTTVDSDQSGTECGLGMGLILCACPQPRFLHHHKLPVARPDMEKDGIWRQSFKRKTI